MDKISASPVKGASTIVDSGMDNTPSLFRTSNSIQSTPLWTSINSCALASHPMVRDVDNNARSPTHRPILGRDRQQFVSWNVYNSRIIKDECLREQSSTTIYGYLKCRSADSIGKKMRSCRWLKHKHTPLIFKKQRLEPFYYHSRCSTSSITYPCTSHGFIVPTQRMDQCDQYSST
jgi:hypothetical protein